MVVELKLTDAVAKTRYVFSVFLLNQFSAERVYQLEVNHALREPKDTHRKSHEHIGDQRLNGQASWQHWGYDEVLAHFCAQTNITFTPLPTRP